MKCPHSERCIRHELFCDRVTNCAWPNGDVPYDEIKCDEYNSSSVRKVFSPATIIIIIVVVVIVGLGIVIVLVSLRRRVRLWRRQEEVAAAVVAEETAQLRPISSGPPDGATSLSLSPSAPMATMTTTTVAPAPSAPPPPGPDEMPPEYENPPPYSEVDTFTRT